jgi:phosphotransacetylase
MELSETTRTTTRNAVSQNKGSQVLNAINPTQNQNKALELALEENEELKKRIAELLLISDQHRILNGELRQRINELENQLLARRL